MRPAGKIVLKTLTPLVAHRRLRHLAFIASPANVTAPALEGAFALTQQGVYLTIVGEGSVLRRMPLRRSPLIQTIEIDPARLLSTATADKPAGFHSQTEISLQQRSRFDAVIAPGIFTSAGEAATATWLQLLTRASEHCWLAFEEKNTRPSKSILSILNPLLNKGAGLPYRCREVIEDAARRSRIDGLGFHASEDLLSIRWRSRR